MGDMLQSGAAWLDSKRHENMTKEVSYTRGPNSVDLLATIGRTEFEHADDYGIIHRIESRDFIIRVSDLILASANVLPAAGDEIRETNGSVVEAYKVMAPVGEPPWRYSDLYRVAFRIHTTRFRTEVDGP